MANDYGNAGVHQINRWLWSKLQAFKWNGTDYAYGQYGASPKIDLIPIVPTQQVPELNDIVGGAPFVVYNYKPKSHPQFWISRESCAFAFYDDQEDRLRAVHNYVLDLLKREDWTAQNINSYLGTSGFDFKTFQMLPSDGPGDYSDEGGRLSASVVVQYDFTHEIDGIEGSGLRA